VVKTRLLLISAACLAVPFQVNAETEQLPTIIVEGVAKRPGELGVVPDSSGLKDAASMLKHVPGASVNRNGPLTGIAQYRGMFGNRINVSLDGANFKEVGPNSMDPPLSHIPAALTESLQVYRGIAPVSSGIDTIGGAMSLKTKKGRFADEDETFATSGVLSSGYSSVDDSYFGAGFVSIANQNHKLYAGGSKEEGEDYKFKDDKRVTPTSYDREVYTVGYGYQRDGHQLGLQYTDNNTHKTGTPALPMDIIYVKGGLYDANYQWDIGDGYQLKTRFYYQNMRHLMNNHSLRPPRIMNGGPMLMQNRTEVEGGGLDMAFTMPLFSGALTMGVNGDRSNHDAFISGSMLMPMMGGMPGMTMRMPIAIKNFNDVSRERYSGFLEWKGDLMDDLSAEFGLRYTYTYSNAGAVSTSRMLLPNGVNERVLATRFNDLDHEKYFHDVELVSIFRYTATDNLNLEIGFARKNRAPSYQELYLWSPGEATGGLADGRNYVGNLNLKTENAYQFELGAEYHTDDLYVAPRVFYHYVKDYIQGTPVAGFGNGTLQFNNIDAQLWGLDIEASYRIDDHWRLDGGLNYVRGQQIGGQGGNLYRIAPLNGRAQITFEHSGWMAAVEGVFYDRMEDVAGYNDEQVTPGYFLLNLKAKYEPDLIKGLVIGAGIDNVIDQKHFDHLGGYYRVSGNPDVAQGGRIPMNGRNFYATLSYQW